MYLRYTLFIPNHNVFLQRGINMKIKVYTNKVVLVDEQGNIQAGIDYPKTQHGICEIGGVYRTSFVSNPEIEAKLMELALKQVRKKNLQVVCTDAFSREWFNKHPEDRDLVAPQLSQAPTSVGETQVVDLKKIESEVQQNAEKPVIASEEPEQDVVDFTPNFFCRFLQFLSAVLMLTITAVYGYKVFQYTSRLTGSDGILSILSIPLTNVQLVFLVGSCVLIVLGIIQFFWILSTKKSSDNGVTVVIDKGRGFCAFIILLLLYLVITGLVMYPTVIPGYDMSLIIPSFFEEAIVRQFIPLLGIIGWIFCFIRRMIGKPKNKH